MKNIFKKVTELFEDEMIGWEVYLSSFDYRPFKEIRTCIVKKKVYVNGMKAIIVNVSPGVNKNIYKGKSDADQVILLTRFEGLNLFKIKKWPYFIKILIPKDGHIDPTKKILLEDYAFGGTGEIYIDKSEIDVSTRTKEEEKEFLEQFSITEVKIDKPQNLNER